MARKDVLKATVNLVRSEEAFVGDSLGVLLQSRPKKRLRPDKNREGYEAYQGPDDNDPRSRIDWVVLARRRRVLAG
jgi:hypothetical protein